MLIRTHTVTKYLLSQFAPAGSLQVKSELTGQWSLAAPRDVGFLWLPEELIGESEIRWNSTIESRFPHVIDEVMAGRVLENKKNIEVIKSLIALHFVRSKSFIVLLKQNADLVYSNALVELEKYYISPEIARKRWNLETLKSLPTLLRDFERKVQEYIDQHEIEIAVAPHRNRFIIGDSPVVNVSDDDKVGVLNGVAFKQSVGVFLPLTPWHIVALADKAHYKNYLNLSANQVRAFNKLTKRQCISEYYALGS